MELMLFLQWILQIFHLCRSFSFETKPPLGRDANIRRIKARFLVVRSSRSNEKGHKYTDAKENGGLLLIILRFLLADMDSK